MGSVRSVQIIELLPCRQFLVEIHVIRIGQQLVELLLVGSVRPLDLSVQLGRSGLDVHMPDALVLDVPVERCLPFMAAIGTNCMDAERELLYDVVDEVNRVLLSVPSVDPQGAYPSGVIDGRVLIPTYLLPVLAG